MKSTATDGTLCVTVSSSSMRVVQMFIIKGQLSANHRHNLTIQKQHRGTSNLIRNDSSLEAGPLLSKTSNCKVYCLQCERGV